MLISRDGNNSQRSRAGMRILPWGFAERTSPKFFLESWLFSSLKIKKDMGRLGEGDKLFSFFYYFFFSVCWSAVCEYKTFPIFFLIFGVFFQTANCKKFKNKEKTQPHLIHCFPSTKRCKPFTENIESYIFCKSYFQF